MSLRNEAMEKFRNGADASEVIALLRRAAEDPTGKVITRWDLALVYQSEGRKKEAAECAWELMHCPQGEEVNMLYGDLGRTCRAIDMFEDAGRRDDARWASQTLGFKTPGDAYASIEIGTNNLGGVYWQKKLFKKAALAKPEDKKVKRLLEFAEREVAEMERKGRKPSRFDPRPSE